MPDTTMMNFSFVQFNNKTDEEFKEQISQALNYLNAIDDISNVFNDQNAYNAFCFICYTSAYKPNYIFEYFDMQHCEILFSKIFSYFSTIQNEINFDETVKFNSAENLTDLNEKRATLFCLLFYAVNIYMMKSINFCIKFSSNDGLKAWLSFLTNKKFLEKNLNSQIKVFSRHTNPIDYIILNISALSKACEEDKKIWSELDTINILLNVCKIKESVKNDAYYTIINIADDEQLENVAEIENVKKTIISQLEKTTQEMSQNLLNRNIKKINFKGEKINCNIHCIILENKSILSIFVILKALYKLTINEKMKKNLFYETSLMTNLKLILLKGNYFEIYYVMEILAQLAFDKKIAESLAKDSELKEFFEKIEKQNLDDITDEGEKTFFKSIEKIVEQIKWNMLQKVIKDEELEMEDHVMISYNTSSRDMCLKIKENLEEFGVKVWMDVDEEQGSSLDTITKSVEKSFCVLICVTEKYRQSLTCQTEAQYAFKLNKKIIPLIMQNGYEKTQGWLGVIMDDKIFINFIKYEIKVCFQRLRTEICRLMKYRKANNKPTENSDALFNPTSQSNAVENWSENDVKEWFNKNNINQAILEHLMPCSGVVIKQIYDMKISAPEFYYHSLKEIPGVNLNSLSIFTHFLIKLFL